VFLASHLLTGVLLLYYALTAASKEQCLSFLRLAAAALALVAFTKNEGLVLYLPSLTVLATFTLWKSRRRGLLSQRDTLLAAGWFLGALALVAGPWILFKSLHRLTYGNAKAISGLSLVWQPGVILAILVNTFLEGNWLVFFPLFFLLLILHR